MVNGNYLFLADLQIPYEHEKALEFATYLKRHFKINDDNCYCVGDETDQFHGSLYDRGADYPHTPREEIAISTHKLKSWYKVFPKLKIATSNHGTRWMRKAFKAEIPSEMIREYSTLIQAPDNWVWKKYWKINSKHPILLEHGDDWGGQYPHINSAIHNGISTVIGHHHSLASVSFIKTTGQDIWGAVIGSLIDFDAYAFEYAKSSRRKPQIGSLVVLNDGRMPIWVPLD